MSIINDSFSTSSSILDRVRGDDEEAWYRLCHLYAPIIYRWTRQGGLQDADAADVAQDVFASVAGAINEFQHGGPNSTFRGWLWTITRNKIRDHYRLRNGSPKSVGGDGLDQFEGIPESLPEPTDDLELSYVVRRALDLLETDFEPQTWSAFLRLTMDAQPATSVAEELQMSVGAVYVAKSRVLKRLRAELKGLL